MKLRKGISGGRGERSGSALVLSLIAVMTVSVLAASFLQVSSAVTARQKAAIDNKHSFYLAEAGLIEAYAGIQVGKTGNVGTMAMPAKFGEGLFWVEATEVDGGLVQLRATGMHGAGKATLDLVVERGVMDMAALGVFSSEDLEIQEGALIDGYDSRDGDYEVQVEDGEAEALLRGTLETVTTTVGGVVGGVLGGGGLGAVTEPVTTILSPPELGDQVADEDVKIGMGNVGSNGSITVHGSDQSPTQIFGAVAPGPSGQVTLVGTPEITGDVLPAVTTVALPAVQLPTVPKQKGTTLSNGLVNLLDSGAMGFSYIDVTGGSELVLQGPSSIVVGDLTVGGSSQLTFDTTNGPIDLFVTGSLVFDDTSSVATSSTDPSQVRLEMANTGTAELSAASQFFGMIYAPEASVALGAGFEVFGAIVANSLSLAQNARLHFDVYLAELALDKARPTNLSWRIVDFAPIASGNGANNPFKVLNVDPTTLPRPSLAHEDQVLDLSYIDLGGFVTTYLGSENAFDWKLVDSVLGGTRDGLSLLLSGTNKTTTIR